MIREYEGGQAREHAEAAAKSLTQHVEAYEQALRDGVASRKQKGRPATTMHVQKTGNRIRTLIKDTGAPTFGDISPAARGRCLRRLELKGARQKGIGPKTAAHYHAALYAFLQWAVRGGALDTGGRAEGAVAVNPAIQGGLQCSVAHASEPKRAQKETPPRGLEPLSPA
jgi:hypothetical protein